MLVQLSSYLYKLEKEAKDLYKKISLINGVDPFGKVTEGEKFHGYPPVEDYNLASSNQFCKYEGEERIGLKAYNQFVRG